MKNNLKTNKNSQNVVLGDGVCFNKKGKKKKEKVIKHVFCKLDLCFKLKKKEKRQE